MNRQLIRQWLFVVVGAALLATAFVLFITPYRIVPGGVYGMGVVLNYLFPAIQVGTYGLSMDIPLLLIAFRLFGAKFGSKTIVAALLTPLFMDSMTYLIGSDPATMLGGKIDLSGDVLLSCIFGGILCIYTYWISKKNNWGGKGKMASGQEIMKCFIDALWGIFSPVIVLGGIYSGILTPTESAAVAVIYSYLVGTFVYKELNFKDHRHHPPYHHERRYFLLGLDRARYCRSLNRVRHFLNLRQDYHVAYHQRRILVRRMRNGQHLSSVHLGSYRNADC